MDHFFNKCLIKRAFIKREEIKHQNTMFKAVLEKKQ